MAKGVLVGGTKRHNPKTGVNAFTVDMLDLDGGKTARIDVDFLAHGLAVHPLVGHIAAFFEKRGPDACLVDFSRGTLIRPLATAPNRAFYGHGFFSKDGTKLFAVEIDTDTHRGLVSVRDTKNYATFAEFPTFGENPHDCVLVDDGKTLVITNGGGALGSNLEPSVTYVDVESQSLKQKFTFGDPKINAGHIAIAENGDFVVVSAPRDGLPELTSLGGVTLRVGNQKPVRMKPPSNVMERMKGETLSVCIHDASRTALATNPHGNIVTVWDLDRMKLKTTLEIEFPRGVTLSLDRETFIITHGTSGHMTHVSTHDLSTKTSAMGLFSGSHVYAWKKPRASASPEV